MAKNYMSAPVDSGDLLGRFSLAPGEGHPVEPLTVEDCAFLAGLVNHAAEHGAVWFNPETDSKLLKVHGTPVAIGGRAVRLTSRSEVAVFPTPTTIAA